MAVTRLVRVGDRDVTVKELTFGEIRDVMAAAETPQEAAPAVMTALALLDDPADQTALLLLGDITDFPADALADVEPSVLREVLLAACREVNADFFGMLSRTRAAIPSSSVGS
jgi:hypothetical protein